MLRHAHPDAHISACGRNQQDQEDDVKRGVSHAHWGQSAHNYNAALDWFRLTQQAGASWDAVWLRDVLGQAVQSDPKLTWGGTFVTIHDLPHVEWKSWKEDAKSGLLKLV